MALTNIFNFNNLSSLNIVRRQQYVRTHNSRRMIISCSVNTQKIVHNNPEHETRRSANYQPTSWSYDFVQSLNNVNADLIQRDEAKRLEEDFRCAMNSYGVEFLSMLETIDHVQRLGLGYRYQEDIRKGLCRFFSIGGYNQIKAMNSLHATSLCFRLLRQHGFEISQDIFKEFLGDNGFLMPCHHKDIQGLLSWYEALHVTFEAEELFSKAISQTKMLLQNFEMTPHSVARAMELPLNRKMVFLEKRCYIEEYSKRKDANYSLLRLAKLDFNMVQSVLQRDLKDMSRWWNKMGLASKLRFNRDRLMECFFWTVGMGFEPQLSHFRKGLTKVMSFITTIDDVYDIYGTMDELQLFTDAVERWDVNALSELPEYLKICFFALYNTVNEMAYDTLKEQGENVVPYLAKAWADLCKAFLQEAQWSSNKFTPSSEKYYENGWRSASGTVLLVHSYFLLRQNLSKEALDCLMHYHDLLRWPSVIFRLCNDLETSSAELQRGETTNSIACYMNDAGVSEEEARKKVNELIEEAWKKMNELENDSTNPFERPFIDAAMNLARTAQYTYQHGDGIGAPDEKSQRIIVSLIVDPVH